MAELRAALREEQRLRRAEIADREKFRRQQTVKNWLLAGCLVAVAGLGLAGYLNNQREAERLERTRCLASVETRTAVRDVDAERGDALVAVAELLAGPDDEVTRALRAVNHRIQTEWARNLPIPEC